jgi:hypothetical protein
LFFFDRGKFGQRAFPTEKVVTQVGFRTLVERARNKEVEIIAEEVLGEDAIWVSYQDNSDDSGRAKRNVAVAAYVTCWGRLELLKGMRRCGDKLLGHDTGKCVLSYCVIRIILTPCFFSFSR